MDADAIAKYINQFGFPIIAAGGMGYIVYFVWLWATTVVKPILQEATDALIELIDQIRVLDNDMIRLTQKFLLDSVLEKIKSLIGIIKQLDKRVTAMSQDITRIDDLASTALNIPQEKDRPRPPPVERKD